MSWRKEIPGSVGIIKEGYMEKEGGELGLLTHYLLEVRDNALQKVTSCVDI